MKGAFVLLLSLFLSCGFAAHCINQTNFNCCGDLLVGTFSIGIHETLAQQNHYFEQEGITVCYYRIQQSVVLYDQLLAGGQIDVAYSQVDNGLWRRLNNSVDLTVLSGNDGQRGFWLLGNTKVLDGHNYASALSGKTVVVDSVDSGYVVGLKKTLRDFGVTDVNYVTFGTNRLPIVQQGNLSTTPVAASMINNIAPYLYSYPVVTLAQQSEHLCPSQGGSYITNSAWITQAQNRALMAKYFRALLKAYQFEIDPANRAAINTFLQGSIPSTDPNVIELQFDDYFKNPATGLNPWLVPRKAGIRNLVNARISLGLSPYPAEGIESFITNKVGGFVDLGPLLDAQASLGINGNTYDTDSGLAGCPVDSTGCVVSVPPQVLCTATYNIQVQPPNWPNGLTASLSITVDNPSLLTRNGQPGWEIQFTAKGQGSSAPFQITSSWNTGSVSSTVDANGQRIYTITNAAYNSQDPTHLGWNAATSLASPYNNICGVSINGFQCQVAGDASQTC